MSYSITFFKSIKPGDNDAIITDVRGAETFATVTVRRHGALTRYAVTAGESLNGTVPSTTQHSDGRGTALGSNVQVDVYAWAHFLKSLRESGKNYKEFAAIVDVSHKALTKWISRVKQDPSYIPIMKESSAHKIRSWYERRIVL